MVCSRIFRVLLILGLVAVLIPVTLAQAQAGSGTVVIRDGTALSDTATVTMTDVPALGADEAYEGWFVSDDGSISTGILSVANGRIDQVLTPEEGGFNPTGANLFSNYNKFVITIEPVPDDDPASSGNIAFSHEIPAGGLTEIRALLVSWPSNPDSTAIAVGLRDQTEEALLRAQLAQQTAQAGSLALTQDYACHVVNIIEGYTAADDGGCPGPGDTFGVINYASDAAAHASLAATNAPGDDTIAQSAPAVIAAANAVASSAAEASAQASLAMGTSSLLAARLYMDNVVMLLSSDAPSGASRQAGLAYTSAQDMGAYTLASLPSVGDPLVPQVVRGGLIAGIVLLLAGLAIYTRTVLRPRRS